MEFMAGGPVVRDGRLPFTGSGADEVRIAWPARERASLYVMMTNPRPLPLYSMRKRVLVYSPAEPFSFDRGYTGQVSKAGTCARPMCDSSRAPLCRTTTSTRVSPTASCGAVT